MPRVKHRKDRLTWDDHHMLLALVTSQRSPDPNTQVGACVVDQKNRVVGVGYNGLPRGISPCQISWAREHEDPCKTKYPYVVHAETNAIVNAAGPVDGCVLYVTMFSCNECAKDIIQAGIREVVYLTHPYEGTWSTEAAMKMFQLVDISCRQHHWNSERLNTPIQNVLKCVLETPGGSNLHGTLLRCATDSGETGSD